MFDNVTFNNLLPCSFAHTFRFRIMLGRNNNSVNTLDHIVFVLKSHLAFRIRAEIGYCCSLFAHVSKLFDQLLCKLNSSWHKLRSLCAGIAEHHTLITGANTVKLVSNLFLAVNTTVDIG